MRIAYVCADPGIPIFGTKGASVHVQEVMGVLLAAGHTVTVFAARTGNDMWPNLAAAVSEGRFRVRKLPLVRVSDVSLRERALQAVDHVNATRVAGEGSFDLLYERYSLWSKSCVAHARRLQIPVVLEVNAPLPLEQARHRSLVHEQAARDVFISAASAATVVMCVSQAVADWATPQLHSVHHPPRQGFGDSPTPRVIVEPNGVNIERFQSTTPSSVPRKMFTVGFVGTLKPWHGTHELVDAFASFHRERPQSQLLIVGDGPERGSLLAQVKAAGISDCTSFTGPVSPQDIPMYLSRMDVGVAPYPAGGKENYFSPLKVYEYMAAKLAVVATDVGQLSHVLSDESTGLLVPGSDGRALTDALIRLFDDPPLRHRLQEAAGQQAATHHTWTKVVDRTLAAAGISLTSARNSPSPFRPSQVG